MERETIDEEDSIRNEHPAQGNLNPVLTSIDGKIEPITKVPEQN